MLDSDEFYTPVGAMQPGGTTFRDAYLNKISAGVLAVADTDLIALTQKYAELVHAGIDPYEDSVFLGMNKRYESTLTIGNFFLSEVLFIEKRGGNAKNYSASKLHFDELGQLVFTMSYHKIPIGEKKSKKEIETGLISDPSQYANLKDSERLLAILQERDNLLLNTVIDISKDLFGGLIARYGNDGVKLMVAISETIGSGKAGNLGMDNMVDNNHSQAGIDATNQLFAGLINYFVEKGQPSKLSEEGLKVKMNWFGTGGYYKVAGEGKGTSFIGINDPKISFHISEWQQNGMTSWYDFEMTEKEIETMVTNINRNLYINIKAENAEDFPDKTKIKSLKKQQDMLKGLIYGRNEDANGFTLNSDEEVLAFNTLIDEIQEYKKGDNIQDAWKETVKKVPKANRVYK